MKLNVIYPYDIDEVELLEDKIVFSNSQIRILEKIDDYTYKIQFNDEEFCFMHNGLDCVMGPFAKTYMYHNVTEPLLWKISRKKALFAEVSKNACSTVISHIYNNFYPLFPYFTFDKFKPDDKWIWEWITPKERSAMTISTSNYLKQKNKNYKTFFLVYDDPVKRFVRALNNKYTKQDSILSLAEPLYDKDLERFINQMILLTKFNLLNIVGFDQHIAPISIYHKKVLPYVTHFVYLKDLDRFLKEKFNINPQHFYKSHEKIITYETLKDYQIKEIMEIYKDDYSIPIIYKDKFYK